MVYLQCYAITLPIFIQLVFIYCYIIRVVKRHQRRLRRLSMKSSSRISSESDQGRKDTITIKLFAGGMLILMIFWLPLNIDSVLLSQHIHTPTGLRTFFIVMSHANSAVNPYIYTYNNSRIRQAVKLLVSSLYFKRTQKPSLSSSKKSGISYAYILKKLTPPSRGLADSRAGHGSRHNHMHLVGSRAGHGSRHKSLAGSRAGHGSRHNMRGGHENILFV